MDKTPKNDWDERWKKMQARDQLLERFAAAGFVLVFLWFIYLAFIYES